MRISRCTVGRVANANNNTDCTVFLPTIQIMNVAVSSVTGLNSQVAAYADVMIFPLSSASLHDHHEPINKLSKYSNHRDSMNRDSFHLSHIVK